VQKDKREFVTTKPWKARAMALLKRYFRDIKEEGRFSDLLILIGGGAIFFSGMIVAAVDFVSIQRMIYVFNPVTLSGLPLLPIGSAMRIQARRTLGIHFSPVVRILPEHELITCGIYKHVRHPGYMGELLLYFSIPLLFNSLYGFLVMVLLVPLILYRIKIEEQALIMKFGDEYRNYVKNTRKLIPCVY